MSPEEAAKLVPLIPEALRIEVANHFRPNPGQAVPPGDWTTWLILAGRGFGKTRTGAEWVNAVASAHGGTRIALVGATAHDARSVMVEGAAGLLAVNPAITFEPSRRLLCWPNHSRAMLFSAEEPDTLRGPEFSFAWGDEVARWPDGKVTLATLRMALRVGLRPRLLLTTTPKPLPWLKALDAEAGTVLTRGRTTDNAQNLAQTYLDAMVRDYGGTTLGRQELDGEFIEEVEGALWSRALIEACRIEGVAPQPVRTVIGVDPPAGAGPNCDACGIIVVGLTTERTAVVLADRTVQGVGPEQWARAVAAAYDDFDADLVVVEVNNGGAMVASVLLAVAPELNIKSVRASVGKVARAEPVAGLYTAGKVRHAEPFPLLEDELCGLSAGGGWSGAGRSPDRADALVWALTELMLAKVRAEPGVRRL
ncbi:DNA-packaging protein [Glacieibacterium sp.]|uniref:DNA-packaging protein n=1 Tax=Glacieibacterium sp. TaxID=2860237 RepID=UPI003B00685C